MPNGWSDADNGTPNLLFINQGDGTFVEEAEARGLAVTDASGMAAFHDYDRDGWLDVYLQTNMLDFTTNPKGQRDYLFHNNGDGTFSDVTVTAGISGETAGHSATWWDYNNDGWPDLYVANDFATPDSLYRNNANGTFTNVTKKAGVFNPDGRAMSAVATDLNNDGFLDIFVANDAMANYYYENTGKGTFEGARKDALGGAVDSVFEFDLTLP